MWVFVVRQYVLWFLTVPVLSSVPIGIHLGAVYVNNRTPDQMPIISVADGFLYVFIVSMTAVTQQILAHRPVATVYYMLFAMVSAVLYAATLVDVVAVRALGVLHVVLVVFCIGVFLPYACSKALEVYGAGKAEWKAALQQTGGVPG